MGRELESGDSNTQSLCPECFCKIPARRVMKGQDVYLVKSCPNHGESSTLVWRGAPSLSEWFRPKIPYVNPIPNTGAQRGCPFDCGLCAGHRQQTCTALLEITGRCNLNCAYCFADASTKPSPDPALSVIRDWYQTVLSSGGACNIQLSGGEPTMRDDLPKIVALGRSMGFKFIQLNTNGLRIAHDRSYLIALKEAGLSSVFLQFDGVSDQIYMKLRGREILNAKLEAIENCGEVGLGVVLVPTLVPGVNTGAIGAIIRFAAENLNVVRGVHFQPVSYFGRYPSKPLDEQRLTLPELMAMIEIQTSGAIRMENFNPPGCENSMCSFHGSFVLMPDGDLVPLTRRGSFKRSMAPEKAEDGAFKTRKFVATNWSKSGSAGYTQGDAGISFGPWDTLLERSRTHMLCVSAMAFQDIWNLDVERLKDCCIHVVGESGRIVPFCAYNLTSSDGSFLYRGRHIR